MAFNCERHTAMVFDRGGRTRLGVIDPLTTIAWGRRRDDISVASLRTTAPSMECLSLLEQVEPNRHELVIYRGSERVWEGPISLVRYASTFVEIEAKDVMYYAYRTVMHAVHNNNYPNVASVTARARAVLTSEMARKEALSPPINMLPHVRSFATANDARTARKTLPMQSTVFEDIDSMAAKAGLDYTVVGRSLLLFDTHTVIGQTPTVTEADFIGDVIVTAHGMEGATRSIVTDGQGNYGVTGGVDSFYGEWENLETAYDENVDGTNVPTVAEMTSQAERNQDGRNPVPVIVRVPDGSRLNPEGVLQMSDLVPGVRIPLRATLTARVVNQMQKLDAMSVTESESTGEIITVTMSPASADDSAGSET